MIFEICHSSRKRFRSLRKSRTRHDRFPGQSVHKFFKMSIKKQDVVVDHAYIFTLRKFNASVPCFCHPDVLLEFVIPYIVHILRQNKIWYYLLCVVCRSVVNDQYFMIDILADFFQVPQTLCGERTLIVNRNYDWKFFHYICFWCGNKNEIISLYRKFSVICQRLIPCFRTK